jgi:uncharacterized protein (TIGR02231 family)
MPTVDAPIVAVTVHPALARIARQGRVEVAAGANEVVVPGLPATLDESSVRVAGRGDVAIRVVGVEVRARTGVDAPDARVAAAEAALRDAEGGLGAIDDLDRAEAARADLLDGVTARGGRAFAQALASGEAEPSRVTAVADALAAALLDVANRQRALSEQRQHAERAVAAARAELDRLRASSRERRDVVVAVEADGAGGLELDVEYVVVGAGWSPVYDVRVDADAATVELTWAAQVRQASGEDWPACPLTVASSRPSHATAIPELDPWWIGTWEPPPRPQLAARAMAKPAGADADAMAGGAAPASQTFAATPFELAAEVAVAEVVDTALAASWLVPRPTAVPGDGSSHRLVLASAPLEARLDHLTAPARSTDVHLRATVTNDTGRALLAGSASVFLDDDFVGVAAIDGTAPGDELELALGVDDRVVAERELVRRHADKRRLGSTRRTDEVWSITVTNHRSRPIDLVVRERVPQSRHAEVKVVDVKLRPEPAEHDELGRFEWRAAVAPGAAFAAEVGFAVEHPKDAQLVGWR